MLQSLKISDLFIFGGFERIDFESLEDFHFENILAVLLRPELLEILMLNHTNLLFHMVQNAGFEAMHVILVHPEVVVVFLDLVLAENFDPQKCLFDSVFGHVGALLLGLKPLFLALFRAVLESFEDILVGRLPKLDEGNGFQPVADLLSSSVLFDLMEAEELHSFIANPFDSLLLEPDSFEYFLD